MWLDLTPAGRKQSSQMKAPLCAAIATIKRPDFGLSLDTPPMGARAADTLPADGGWQYEPKWDGFR